MVDRAIMAVLLLLLGLVLWALRYKHRHITATKSALCDLIVHYVDRMVVEECKAVRRDLAEDLRGALDLLSKLVD